MILVFKSFYLLQREARYIKELNSLGWTTKTGTCQKTKRQIPKKQTWLCVQQSLTELPICRMFNQCNRGYECSLSQRGVPFVSYAAVRNLRRRMIHAIMITVEMYYSNTSLITLVLTYFKTIFPPMFSSCFVLATTRKASNNQSIFLLIFFMRLDILYGLSKLNFM